MVLWSSTVGKKILMAATGLLMLLFLIAHLLGNMSFHLGPAAINSYSEHLRSLGPLLWAERILMLLVLVLHVTTGISLTLDNSRAKTRGYAARRYLRASLASRSMIYTGIVIFCFGLYHLLHLTIRVTNPSFTGFTNAAGHADIYRMAEASFSHPLISLAYVVGLAALLLHLWHGAASFFQSMGWNKDQTMPLVEWGNKALALAVFAAFLSVPASFWLFGA